MGNLDAKSLIAGLVAGLLIFFLLDRWQQSDEVAVVDEQTGSSGHFATADLAPVAQELQQRRLIEGAIQQEVQSLLDEIIGVDRSRVSVRVSVWDYHGAGTAPTVGRLSIALTIDATKVVIDPDTRELAEVERSQNEIDRLADLAEKAAGFDPRRGDQISVYPMVFDKSQEIQAHAAAQAEERKRFWTGIARLVVGVVVVLVGWRFVGRRFFHAPDSKSAALIAVGLFLCAHALGYWGESLELREIGSILGLLLLLVGIARISRALQAPEAEPEEPRSP